MALVLKGQTCTDKVCVAESALMLRSGKRDGGHRRRDEISNLFGQS